MMTIFDYIKGSTTESLDIIIAVYRELEASGVYRPDSPLLKIAKGCGYNSNEFIQVAEFIYTEALSEAYDRLNISLKQIKEVPDA